MTNRSTWTPGIWFLAESAHLGWGAFACFAAFHYHLFLAIPIMAAIALFKEAVIDPLWEGDAFEPDGMIDFAFYILGLPVAALAFYMPDIIQWLKEIP